MGASFAIVIAIFGQSKIAHSEPAVTTATSHSALRLPLAQRLPRKYHPAQYDLN